MQGHDKDQLAKPDTSFISVLRRSHPGCSIALLTDQATQIDLPEDVRLFRFMIDRSKLGRNPYANYYQYLAQVCTDAPALDTLIMGMHCVHLSVECCM